MPFGLSYMYRKVQKSKGSRNWDSTVYQNLSKIPTGRRWTSGLYKFRTGTKLKSIQWQREGFESRTSGLQVLHPNHLRPSSPPACD